MGRVSYVAQQMGSSAVWNTHAGKAMESTKKAGRKSSLNSILANTQGSKEIPECKVPNVPSAFEEQQGSQ